MSKRNHLLDKRIRKVIRADHAKKQIEGVSYRRVRFVKLINKYGRVFYKLADKLKRKDLDAKKD